MCLRVFVLGALTRTSTQRLVCLLRSLNPSQILVKLLARMLKGRRARLLHSPRNVTVPLIPDTEMTEPPEPTFPAKFE